MLANETGLKSAVNINHLFYEEVNSETQTSECLELVNWL